MKELPFTKYFNNELLSEWLDQEKVLEFIFIESPHAELIKRSLELCYVRSKDVKKQITPFLIDNIWKCCVEKHEAIARASFTVLQDLAQHLPS